MLYPAYFRDEGEETWDRPEQVSVEFAQLEYDKAIMRWIRNNPDVARCVLRNELSMDFT